MGKQTFITDPKRGLVGAHVWDGTQWVKQKGDSDGRPVVTKNHEDNADLVFPHVMAVRSTSTYSDIIYNFFYLGGIFTFGVKTVPGGGSTVQFAIVAGNYMGSPLATLLTGTAQAGTGTWHYVWYPGAVAGAMVNDGIVGGLLPPLIYVQIIHAGAGDFEYGVSALLIKAP